MFVVELDNTGWRVVDGCLNFGPYSNRREAEDVARALNRLDWAPCGAEAARDVQGVELDDLIDHPTVN